MFCSPSPGVSVLIPDLLLHLGICKRLQQGAPLVGISRVPDGNLHSGQGILTVREGQQVVTSIRKWNSLLWSCPRESRCDKTQKHWLQIRPQKEDVRRLRKNLKFDGQPRIVTHSYLCPQQSGGIYPFWNRELKLIQNTAARTEHTLTSTSLWSWF